MSRGKIKIRDKREPVNSKKIAESALTWWPVRGEPCMVAWREPLHKVARARNSRTFCILQPKFTNQETSADQHGTSIVAVHEARRALKMDSSPSLFALAHQSFPSPPDRPDAFDLVPRIPRPCPRRGKDALTQALLSTALGLTATKAEDTRRTTGREASGNSMTRH